MRFYIREAQRQLRSIHYGVPELKYTVEMSRLHPELRKAFLQLECDEETYAFLEQCDTGFLESILTGFLGMFYSVTDVNGILGRGEMFVLSKCHLDTLLDFRALGGTLLDIGAGDGNVTRILSSCVDHILTTEVSAPMVSRLKKRGFECIHTSELNHVEICMRKPYSMISLMNVLDRADRPITMLQNIHDLLKLDDGVFLLAVVLPFAAFVEDGTAKKLPQENIHMHGGLCSQGAAFEDAANVLYERVISPAGFELIHFARVPYISCGDWIHPYHILSNGVFLLRKGKHT